MPDENSTQFKIPDTNKRHRGVFVGAFIFLILVSYVGFIQIRAWKIEKEDNLHHDAFRSGILGNDPIPLQNAFMEDLQAGTNDKYTKSDAYFITHRFFDNGGNVYEIYDYINSHPELAFLKEAETKYPKIFEQLHNGTIPKVFVDRSYYVYLAYVEVLYNHGYTDVAAVSTLANQYAKLAYFNTVHATEMDTEAGARRAYWVKRDANEAWKFLEIAKPMVEDVLSGKITDADVPARDILVGLNQYAAATRYLQALIEMAQIPTDEMPSIYRNAPQIFNFAMEYSHKNVPELALFTSLVNASTLVLLQSADPNDIKVALFPLLDFDPKIPTLSNASIIHKILDSRLEEPALPGDTDLDLYSKRNAILLASKVPEFKTWLLNNGWQESDF